MVSLRRIAWLVGLGLVLSSASLAQRQLEQITPTSAALLLSSELDKNSREYDWAIGDIVSTYVTGDDYASAFKALSALNPSEQVEPLHSIAVAAIDSRRNEEARTALNLALKLLLKEPETMWLQAFAFRAIDIGDYTLASKFIDAIAEDSARKAQALVSLGLAYLRQGEKEAAVVALNAALVQHKSLQTEEVFEFFKLVPPLTKLLIEVGDRERAVELVKLADQTPVPKDDLNEERYKSSRSAAFATVGDFERALAITESQEGEVKSEGIVELALGYAKMGNSAAAMSSIRYAIAETPQNDNLLKKIVTAYLKLGRPDEAFAVLQQMHDQFVLVQSAIELAQHFHAINRSQDAVSALDVAFLESRKMVSEKSDEIPSSASFSIAKQKSMGLSSLGRAYLEIGHLSGAEKAANAVDQPQHQASLLTLVAVFYRNTGNRAKSGSLLKKAFALSAKADNYNHDMWRTEALLRIAEAYADAGLKSEAEEVVLSFLGELQKDENQHLTISGLISIGRVCDKGGIPLDKSGQSLLLNIVAKYREDH